jgi:beta-xylosidase
MTLVCLSCFPAFAQEATPEAETFTNPVIAQDFPDPDILEVDGVYYAYATNSGSTNIQVARSADLVNWELLPDALPALPEWAAQDFGWAWAPDVSQREDGTFLMYFVAKYAVGEAGPQCIGTATSDTPEGPFAPVGDEPFICQQNLGGSIDPASFIDADGTRYLLWKNDGNCCGGQTWIFLQATSDDGLALVGEPLQLITADQAWEGVLVEGPTLWQQNDQYYLFYSANNYTSPNYSVGWAAADEIDGPYTKARQPLLETTIRAGIVGPGGQDIVIDDDGEAWIAFHGWSSNSGRTMSLLPLTWEDDAPVVEPSRDPQQIP